MCTSLLFALCLFGLSGVKGAPTRADEIKFAECKTQSIKLNVMARDLYNMVSKSPKIASIIVDPPVSIRPIDACDPLSLQSNTESCKSRIIMALKNYTTIFQKDGVFKNPACSEWRNQANKIAEVTGKLLQLLKETVDHAPLTGEDWYDNTLCLDSVERLYSFSIISARVFSFLASPVAPSVELKQC